MTLTRHDRCDACHVAAALVRVNVSERVLDFCLHHMGVHESALAAAGAEVLIDQRDQFTASATTSSTGEDHA